MVRVVVTIQGLRDRAPLRFESDQLWMLFGNLAEIK
jgi:hypothetical protein